MSRVVGNRLLSQNSIVIVCEGTETEQAYFAELAKYFPYTCKVVPDSSEIVDKEAKRKRQTEIRKLLASGDETQAMGPEYYVGLTEISKGIYADYKAEPIRWVRAAHLFQEKMHFHEAWAVYDLDKGRDRAHPIAYSMQTNSMHIAFSAYSIEEWFLLHFERNPHAFYESECKDANDKPVNCGISGCTSPLNCKGRKCIGGYLRQKGYIPKYDKNLGKDYAKITVQLFHKACVNAAWSRSLLPNPPYECNPYSDVDKLVMRLLRTPYTIEWKAIGETFELAGEKYHLDNREDGLFLVYEGTSPIVIISNDRVFWCNDEYTIKQSACNGANINFSSKKKEAILHNKPDLKAILCIKNGGNEVYVEIDNNYE